jgi:cellulose synthase/poly-beta-1,6-N-acetylglucosamine synthase-like glycosyltransferase
MSLELFCQAVIVVGLALPFYAYAGYPLLLLAMRPFLQRPIQKQPFEPTVSLLITAYGEGELVAEKIRNVRLLDYPQDKLEVVVACDGPKNDTAEFAQAEAEGSPVRVIAYPVNRGKIASLNSSVPQLKNDIVVFSDASAMLYPDSLRKLMENFADPTVGAVSGKYKVVKADEVHIGQSEDFYWKYETFLKVVESELSSTLGAHGHLHAIRRDLYPFPPPGTINDDYVIPVSVLGKGYRAVYEPQAIVYEQAVEMAGFGRRIRVMAGNIQQVREIRSVLTRPLPLFFFLSHKVSRLAVPFGMLAALIANLFLLDIEFFRYLFFAQAAFYALAAIGTFVPLPKLLLLPYYFCMINVATFFGAYYAIVSLRKMSWK